MKILIVEDEIDLVESIVTYLQNDGYLCESANDGITPVVPTDELFYRFRKANPNSESLGLGLSIAHQISSFHGLKLQYIFNQKQHTLLLTF